jgi:hypothetical protein
MTPSGHATREESDRIAMLRQKRASGNLSCDEALEFGVMLLEPCHDGFTAVEVFSDAAASCGGSRHVLAIIWMAYTYIYEWMDDESLARAVHLCSEAASELAEAAIRSAAHLLSASALQQLGRSREAEANVRLSVAEAEDWVSNRQILAAIEIAHGEHRRAVRHLDQAIASVVAFSPPREILALRFESLITGRASYDIERRLQKQRDELVRLMNSG